MCTVSVQTSAGRYHYQPILRHNTVKNTAVLGSTMTIPLLSPQLIGPRCSQSSRWGSRCLYSLNISNIIKNWHSIFRCSLPKCYNGVWVRIVRRHVVRRCQIATWSLQAPSCGCFVVICSKKFKEMCNVELWLETALLVYCRRFNCSATVVLW